MNNIFPKVLSNKILDFAGDLNLRLKESEKKYNIHKHFDNTIKEIELLYKYDKKLIPSILIFELYLFKKSIINKNYIYQKLKNIITHVFLSDYEIMSAFSNEIYVIGPDITFNINNGIKNHDIDSYTIIDFKYQLCKIILNFLNILSKNEKEIEKEIENLHYFQTKNMIRDEINRRLKYFLDSNHLIKNN